MCKPRIFADRQTISCLQGCCLLYTSIHLEQQRSKEEAELLRIFSGLDVKRRMELLMTAIRLDEEQNQ